MKLKITLCISVLFVTTQLFSQKSENAILTKQCKIDIDSKEQKIIPCGKNGVFISYSPINEEKDLNIYFDHYDVNFNKQSTVKIENPESLKLISYVVSDTELFCILTDYKPNITEFERPIFTKYMVIKFNLETKKHELISGIISQEINLVDIDLLNGNIALIGQTTRYVKQNETGICVLLNFAEEKPTKKEYFFSRIDNKNISKISDIAFNDSTESFHLFSQTYKNKMVKNYIRQIDKNETASDIELDNPIETFPVDPFIKNLGKNRQIIVALEGDPQINSGHVVNSGIVFWEVVNGKQVLMSEIKYLDLKNFEVQADGQKMNFGGKELKNIIESSRIIFHDVIEEEDGYLILGEHYEPFKCLIGESIHVTESNFPRISDKSVFCGNSSISGFIVKISKTGKLIWDYGFISMPYGRYSIDLTKRFLFVDQGNNGKKISFSDNDKIYSINVSQDGKTSTLVADDINLPVGSKIKSNDQKDFFITNGIDFWYDNYSISFSMEKIKVKKSETGLKYPTYFNLSKYDYTID